MWHVLQPNPELRRYRLLFSVTRPPAAVFSHEDYGEAAREKASYEKYGHLTAEAVAKQMQQALRGECGVQYVGPSLDPSYPSGDEAFMVGDMRVVVFFDCGNFDYVDHAVSANGVLWELPEWPDEWDPDNPPEAARHPEDDMYWYPEFGAKDWPRMLDEMLKAAMWRAAMEKKRLEG